jgi:hypothetical protein
MTGRWFLGVFTIVAVWTSGACGPETTSFRAAETTDEPNRPGPPSAAYDVAMAEQPIAQVHVWSNGGYLSISEEPMTHVGFEIRNTSAWPIQFDGDALTLTVFDNTAAALPVAEISSVEPLGPTLHSIRPGDSLLLGAYFHVPVRPRAVDTMAVQWALRADGKRYLQVTRFTRNDDAPVVAPGPIEARSTRS